MFTHAYHLLCLHRQDLHKPNVDWHYANFCSANIKHTALAYGDDVQGESKNISDDSKYSNTIRDGYYYLQQDHAIISGVARAFPGGRAAHPEDQNEEENEENLRKNGRTYRKMRKD